MNGLDFLFGDALANNTLYLIISLAMMLFLLVYVVSRVINKYRKAENKAISIPFCAAMVLAWSILTQAHANAASILQWKTEVTEKAASYTIYIDGIEVENENIDILSYNRKNVVIDDDANTIRIASV